VPIPKPSLLINYFLLAAPFTRTFVCLLGLLTPTIVIIAVRKFNLFQKSLSQLLFIFSLVKILNFQRTRHVRFKFYFGSLVLSTKIWAPKFTQVKSSTSKCCLGVGLLELKSTQLDLNSPLFDTFREITIAFTPKTLT